MRPEPLAVLAVDGGQSAIRVRHSVAGGWVEVQGVSRGEGDVVGSVVHTVVQGWRAAGSPRTDRVMLGLTTAPAEHDAQERLCGEIGAAVGAGEVWLADDAVTAHAGALSSGWGVSVTAGTGVACLAMPEEEGVPVVIGGHGFLLGDEGGGFWLGREGLRAVLRAADGRGPATSLEDAAAEGFGGLTDLSARIHALPRAVDAIARFAPAVLGAAEAGDPEADRIVDEAVAELVALVAAGVAAAGRRAGAASGGAGRSPAGGIPVALGGRLLAPATVLRGRLDAALPREVPAAEVRGADGSPLDGAMALGMAADPGRYQRLVTTWTRER